MTYATSAPATSGGQNPVSECALRWWARTSMGPSRRGVPASVKTLSSFPPLSCLSQHPKSTIDMATLADNNQQPICQNCTTSTTPLWRRDEVGSVLCNACGLFLKLHGRPRPISLKTDVIKSRNRVKTSGQGPKKKVSFDDCPWGLLTRANAAPASNSRIMASTMPAPLPARRPLTRLPTTAVRKRSRPAHRNARPRRYRAPAPPAWATTRPTLLPSTTSTV